LARRKTLQDDQLDDDPLPLRKRSDSVSKIEGYAGGVYLLFQPGVVFFVQNTLAGQASLGLVLAPSSASFGGHEVGGDPEKPRNCAALCGVEEMRRLNDL
jgi:hypothetical protein